MAIIQISINPKKNKFPKKYQKRLKNWNKKFNTLELLKNNYNNILLNELWNKFQKQNN